MNFFLGRRLKDLIAFQMVPRRERRIVIYSEGSAYWPHLSEIVYALLDLVDTPILYVSSDPDDPGMSVDQPKLRSFLTDTGSLRNWLFENLDADIAVMTMPDLDQFQVRRSRNPVHYIYVQHSVVSLHMIYREHAFSAFDTLCCAGPHHVAEARALEKACGTPAKRLLEHGYGRLDQIIGAADTRASEMANRMGDYPKSVLIAPSWGPCGIIEGGCTDLIDALLAHNFAVTLRPHPQTCRLAADKLTEICSLYGDHPRFSLERDVSGYETLLSSDIMISDWSGVAIDFAFGRLGPVIFLDVPRKVNNPNYEELLIEPFEVSIRDKIGVVVKPDEIEKIVAHVETMTANSIETRNTLKKIRSDYVYNLGDSGRIAAREIIKLLDNR